MNWSAVFYELCNKYGFTPREVTDMTLWQILYLLNG